MNTPTILRLIIKYLRQQHPGFEADEIVIKGKSGKQIMLPFESIAASGYPIADSGDLNALLEDTERLIFSNVPNHDQPGSTLEVIRKACGFDDNNHCRKVLRKLMNKGKVVKDDRGYKKAK